MEPKIHVVRTKEAGEQVSEEVADLNKEYSNTDIENRDSPDLLCDGFELLCKGLLLEGVRADEETISCLKKIEEYEWLLCRINKGVGAAIFYYMRYPEIVICSKANAISIGFMEYDCRKLSKLFNGQNVVKFWFYSRLDFTLTGDGSISLSPAVFCDFYYKAVQVDLDVPKITT